jgi:hypothetical protein
MAGAVDLLSLIDPAGDAIFGSWSREQGGLGDGGGVGQNETAHRLLFPIRFDGDYALRLEVVRVVHWNDPPKAEGN